MKLTRLVALLSTRLLAVDPDPYWTRVLRDYSRGNVTLYRNRDPNWIPGSQIKVTPDKIVQERMPTVKFIRLAEPLMCRGILYTSHDASRVADYALDMVKAEWALSQGACFMRVNIDIPTSISGATAPADVIKAWRRRSPNNPIVLVDRYKSGLLLAAMVRSNMIKHPRSTSARKVTPWIFYADGDVGMTNMHKSLDKLVEEAIRASHRPTMEERQLAERLSALTNVNLGGDPKNITGLPPDLRKIAQKAVAETKFVGYMQAPPKKRHLHMLFPHGDCLLPRSFVQTGTILFRPTHLSAFVLEVLANSPYQVIDVGPYAMGDQAIMDWTLTSSFGVRWWEHTSNHCKRSNFTRACNERSELSYISQLVKPFTPLGSRYYLNNTDYSSLTRRSDASRDGQTLSMRMRLSGLSNSEPSVETGRDLPFDRRLRSVEMKNITNLRKLVEEDFSDVDPRWFDDQMLADDSWRSPHDSGLITELASEQIDQNSDIARMALKAMNHRYLEKYWNYWQPEPDGSVAFTCSRWTNSPICQSRRRRGDDSPFPYRCGDLLFHLYGCSKSELFEPSLRNLLLNDDACANILPASLRQIISR